MYFRIMMAFSVIQVIFAFYFQHKVWKAIESNRDKWLDGDEAAGITSQLKGAVADLQGQAVSSDEPKPSKGMFKVKQETVQSAFMQVFLEDFGVLAFFFGLVVIFALSWMAKGAVASAAVCDREGPEGFAYYFGMAFFWVAFLYSIAYYCCKCCAGSVQVKKDMPEGYDELQR